MLIIRKMGYRFLINNKELSIAMPNMDLAKVNYSYSYHMWSYFI